MLTTSIDINCLKMFALHRACEEGNLILVSILLEKGLNVNAKDKQGRTPLHIASKIGDKLLAELLFQRGADICCKSARGKIPLDCSHDEEMTLLLVQMMARTGKAQLAKERLQFEELTEKARQKVAKQLDIKSTRKKSIPFSQLLGKRPIANLLGFREPDSRLSSLSNVSDCSRFSEAESGFCEMDKSPDSVSMESVQTDESISSGFISVDDESTTHLTRRATTALTKQEFAALKRSPFMPRSRAISEPPPKRTVKRSSTWNITRTQTGTFPRSVLRNRIYKSVTFPADILLDIAIKNDDFVETCHLIKSRKVDFNRVGCNGLTPLHRAAIEGSYECLQLLIDLGANVNVKDEYGWTPLHDAVFHDHVNCAAVLINAGAALEAETDDFWTVLEMADSDKMIFTIGRALVVKNSDGDKRELMYWEDQVFEPVFDPYRETCV